MVHGHEVRALRYIPKVCIRRILHFLFRSAVTVDSDDADRLRDLRALAGAVRPPRAGRGRRRRRLELLAGAVAEGPAVPPPLLLQPFRRGEHPPPTLPDLSRCGKKETVFETL